MHLDVFQPLGALLECVVLVHRCIHCHLRHEKAEQQTQPRNPDHRLPNDRQAICERRLNLPPQRCVQCPDDRNRRVRDLKAGWELGDERGGEILL